MSPEQPPFHPESQPFSHSSEPLHPTSLPPELADFLQTQEFACLPHATDQGTLFIVKLPTPELVSLRGPVPMEQRHELYTYPTAPVIRVVTRFHDQPGRPLAIESFINVQDPQQGQDYAALSQQRETFFLCYDEQLRHRLTKQFRGLNPETMTQLLGEADRLLASIPPERFDYELAKMVVMNTTHL